MPFIDSVIYIDKRILNIESPAQEITLSSQDNSSTSGVGEKLVVDAFARYRITDPLKYYQTVGVSGADAQLSVLLNSALRSVLGSGDVDRRGARPARRTDGEDAQPDRPAMPSPTASR